MTDPKDLLRRLDEIAASVQATGNGLAVLGLGSVGHETARLDSLSDLDFFVIAKDGSKRAFLENLDWMAAPAPVGWAFQNTKDGHKLLYEDGIFCEYAIFEMDEFANIHAPEGRVVWAAEGLDPLQLQPKPIGARRPYELTDEWRVGEALTNLYVGLARYRRGEKLSAMAFVQSYALARVLELIPQVEPEQPGFRDEFDAVRRVETRFPQFAVSLKEMAPGYEHTPQAARAILDFLDAHFDVNPRMKREIEAFL